MKKFLKSAGTVLVISALLLSILSGCKAKDTDAENSADTENTASETFDKSDSVSETGTESVTDDSETEDITSAPDTEITAESDKTTNANEQPKEPDLTSQQNKEPETDKTPPSTDQEKKPETDKTSASTEQEKEPEKTNIPSSFKACNISTNEFAAFRYWLYTPSNPTNDMPLIVYLHGGSGKGEDLNLITSVDGFPQYLQSGTLGDVRAYVIIPQLPSTQKGWVNASASLYELIQATVSAFKINKANISLTGHSMGGTGTYNLAAAYPTLFARIAPLSGSIRTTADNITKLKNIPIRIFVGSADTIVPPDSSKEFCVALKENKADAQITVFDGADHFSVPALTYLDKSINLIDWLIGR